MVGVLVASVAIVAVAGAGYFFVRKTTRTIAKVMPTPAAPLPVREVRAGTPPPPGATIAPVAAAPSVPVEPPRVILESGLSRNGAFGFPQADAIVLCDRPELRFSVWNNDEFLYVQAILWNDQDAAMGRTNDGREVGDSSVLALGLGARGERTPNLDRNYMLNPWPNQPGLRYTVQRKGGTSGINSDTAGRGAIRYVAISTARKVRVDSFLIPLAEVAKRVGDKVTLAYWGVSREPLWTANSTDVSPDAAPYSFRIPPAKYHEITLRRGGAFPSAQVPHDKKDEPRPVASQLSAPRPPAGPPEGEVVNIKFTALDGREVDLAKMRGKVVLIDFWATWCGPCVAELPHVLETYHRFHDKGFEIVGISLDSDRARLEKMIADKQMPWPQFFDGKSWQNQFGQQYGIRSIPTMWLVNKEGKLASKSARQDLAGQVEKLLAE